MATKPVTCLSNHHTSWFSLNVWPAQASNNGEFWWILRIINLMVDSNIKQLWFYHQFHPDLWRLPIFSKGSFRYMMKRSNGHITAVYWLVTSENSSMTRPNGDFNNLIGSAEIGTQVVMWIGAKQVNENQQEDLGGPKRWRQPIFGGAFGAGMPAWFFRERGNKKNDCTLQQSNCGLLDNPVKMQGFNGKIIYNGGFYRRVCQPLNSPHLGSAACSHSLFEKIHWWNKAQPGCSNFVSHNLAAIQ